MGIQLYKFLNFNCSEKVDMELIFGFGHIWIRIHYMGSMLDSDQNQIY